MDKIHGRSKPPTPASLSTLLQGFWLVKLPDVPKRPQALIHMCQLEDGDWVIAGYAYSAEGKIRAAWRSTYVCRTRLKIFYLYEAYFAQTGGTFKGFAEIDLQRTSENVLSGRGIFFDLGRNPQTGHQELQKILIPLGPEIESLRTLPPLRSLEAAHLEDRFRTLEVPLLMLLARGEQRRR